MPAITRSTIPDLKLRSVLAAIDFGPLSRDIARYGAAIARLYSADLYLMHVISPASFSSLLRCAVNEESAWRDIRELEQTLISSSGHTGLPQYLVVRKGDVWKQLRDVIERQNIDLVLLGKHYHSNGSDATLGSVAVQAFRNASCPMLIIDPAAIVPELMIKRLLFATDFSDASLDALPYAIGLANHHHAQLIVLHVLRSISCDRKPLIEKTARILTKYLPDVEPETRETFAKPVEAILRLRQRLALRCTSRVLAPDSVPGNFQGRVPSRHIQGKAACTALQLGLRRGHFNYLPFTPTAAPNSWVPSFRQ